jgi:hypothetical protein
MLKEKSTIIAVFDYYKYKPNDLFNKILHFKNIRSEECGIIKREWALDEGTLDKQIVGHLTRGEIVSFKAYIEFMDIEFCYPHSLLREQKNDTK